MHKQTSLISRFTIAELLEKYPFTEEFFLQNRLDTKGSESLTFPEYLAQLDQDEIEEKALDCAELPEQFDIYIHQMAEFLGIQTDNQVRSLTILPGTDKSHVPEGFDELTILPGQIISIVGPTGSGKVVCSQISSGLPRTTPRPDAVSESMVNVLIRNGATLQTTNSSPSSPRT